MELKGRLAALARLVPVGTGVADIGTDHAYLPVWLVQQGRVAKAVAGDVHQGPFKRACVTVQQFHCEQQVAVRLGNGLAVLQPGEVETVILAGMGGPTMVDILTAQPEVTAKLSYLLLQPMVAAEKVRQWLRQNSWFLVEEDLVQEEGRLYQVILAAKLDYKNFEPALNPLDQEILDRLGPKLWEKKHPLLPLHLASLLDSQRNLVAALSKGRSPETEQKWQQAQQLLLRLEEWASGCFQQ